MSLSNNNNNRIWSERNNLAQYYSFLPFTAFSLHHRLLSDVLALWCFAQSSSRNGGICLLEPTNHNLLPHLIASAEFRRLGNPMQRADRQLLCSATRNAGKGSRNQDKDGIIIIGPNQWEICYFLKVLILPSCWLLHSYFATLGPYLFIEISDHSFCWFTGLSGPWPSTTYKTFIIVWKYLDARHQRCTLKIKTFFWVCKRRKLQQVCIILGGPCDNEREVKTTWDGNSITIIILLRYSRPFLISGLK